VDAGVEPLDLNDLLNLLNLSTTCLSACTAVVWRLPFRFHNSGWCSGDAVAEVVSLVKGDHDNEL